MNKGIIDLNTKHKVKRINRCLLLNRIWFRISFMANRGETAIKGVLMNSLDNTHWNHVFKDVLSLATAGVNTPIIMINYISSTNSSGFYSIAPRIF